MGQGVVKGFGGLPGQGASGSIGNGAGNHQRQLNTVLLKIGLYREGGGFGVEGIEYGFDQNQVRATLDQPVEGFHIVLDQLIEGNVARTGVVHIR